MAKTIGKIGLVILLFTFGCGSEQGGVGDFKDGDTTLLNDTAGEDLAEHVLQYGLYIDIPFVWKKGQMPDPSWMKFGSISF